MSVKTKHTPGPWLYDGKSRDVVRNTNGTAIAQLYKIHADSLQADANLIAAAPELLAAAKLALLIHTEGPDGPDYGDVYEALSEAIAKAEGGQE